ncbi:hypothetical protein G7Z17_g9960 [Cylindrodendrum hubeiense]|uniref:Uncharacterized protein n=1 Tax=Cylindrodendrum hubeiense TaxID=595255 RepID=A0A9P5H3Z0_9HYPO|nr:hypothetical protein G7Z17_g9960 [Cylindrodendrum hubeiense]
MPATAFAEAGPYRYVPMSQRLSVSASQRPSVPASKGESHSCDPVAQRQGRLLPYPKGSISAAETQPSGKGNVCVREGPQAGCRRANGRPRSPLIASRSSKALPSFRPASATVPGDDGTVIPPEEVHHLPEDGRGDAEFSPERPSSGRAPAWHCVAIAETLAPRQRPATRSRGGEPLGRHGAAGAQPASHGVAVARPSARCKRDH